MISFINMQCIHIHCDLPYLACRYQPIQVSLSGNRENCMQAGGDSNSSLGQLGEEEEKLQQEKKLNEDHTMPRDIDNEKIMGPDVMLCDSTSLATASLSFDSVTKTTETINIATAAADSISDDTGSEDSRMNSDREPLLLEN